MVDLLLSFKGVYLARLVTGVIMGERCLFEHLVLQCYIELIN